MQTNFDLAESHVLPAFCNGEGKNYLIAGKG
jgi:hypothetical protein